MPTWERLADDLYLWEDCANVYALRQGDEAVLIDAGSGSCLDHLAEIGVHRVAAVLHTHHHRDQTQGDSALAAAGAAIWAPAQEAELIGDPGRLWRGRDLYNSYSGRSDRFSALRGTALAGTLADYATWTRDGLRLRVLPTPGHTMGSVTLLFDHPGGSRIAFSGDLLYAPGKVWSLSTFQYGYNDTSGAVLSLRSLRALAAQEPDMILPSHGRPMGEPSPGGRAHPQTWLLPPATAGPAPTVADAAIASTVEALEAFCTERGPWGVGLARALDRPLEQVLPHLFRDVHSASSNYVVTSGGHAIWIDYGYPHGLYQTQAGGDAAGKRAILHGLEQLRDEQGVTAIDAVVVTHHHDDHVAAINALREATGAEVWAAENFARVLTDPAAFKTQCVWYEPIPVDRVLPLGVPVPWRDLQLTAHAQPGHTRYACCIDFVVDGCRCLAIGDQFPNNYIYANQFALGDYPATAGIWRALAPDLILPGHGQAQDGPAAIAEMARHGRAVDALHRRLLPLDDVDFGASGQAVEVDPYQAEGRAGQPLPITVTARNPFGHAATVQVALALPAGWRCNPEVAEARAEAHGTVTVTLEISPRAGRRHHRQPYAVELTVDGHPFGQVEEGFVTVLA